MEYIQKIVKENKVLVVFILMALLIFVFWQILSIYRRPLPSMCFEYGYGDNGNTITITNYKCTIIKNVRIPKSIEGKIVKRIREYAFYADGLTNVVIPDSVTQIEEYSFASNNITNLIIPNSIKEISHSAFDGNNIKNIKLPEGITTIGPSAFAFNNIKKIELPNSVVTIDCSAFAYNNLKTITIPKNVQTIGYGAFENNPNLYKIINKTNKAFNWGEIINSTNCSDNTEFITGEVQNICDDLVTVEPCESPNVEIIDK